MQAALVALNLQGTASISGNGTVETLTVGSSTGSFALTVNGTTLSGLSAKIKASDLLNQLGTVVGANNVTVTVTAGGPYTITFATPQTVSVNGSGLGHFDADHIQVIQTTQGDQRIYTISFLTPGGPRPSRSSSPT